MQLRSRYNETYIVFGHLISTTIFPNVTAVRTCNNFVDAKRVGQTNLLLSLQQIQLKSKKVLKIFGFEKEKTLRCFFNALLSINSNKAIYLLAHRRRSKSYISIKNQASQKMYLTHRYNNTYSSSYNLICVKSVSEKRR